MKVEAAVLGSPSLTVLMVYVDVKQQWRRRRRTSELRSCVKMEVAVLGSPSLIVLRTLSVDVKLRLRLRLCRWRFAAEAKAE